MTVRTSDIVPICQGRARPIELAGDVVDSRAEEALTKNSTSYVAFVDVRRLDYHRALEAEHACLVLAGDAVRGLKEASSGQFVSDDELDQALGVKATQ